MLVKQYIHPLRMLPGSLIPQLLGETQEFVLLMRDACDVLIKELGKYYNCISDTCNGEWRLLLKLHHKENT